MIGKRQRKFSNYLLDRSLQLRYVGFVTVMSAIISGALGYLIWRQEADATNYLMLAASDVFSQDSELRADLASRLMSDDHQLIFAMAGAGVGLVVVLSLYLVVMTHKVAGPLYKVSRYFDEWAKGRLGKVYSLRKGDMLQDFYDQFRETHEAVRDRHIEDSQTLRRVLEACEAAGGASGPLADEVSKMRSYLAKREEVTA